MQYTSRLVSRFSKMSWTNNIPRDRFCASAAFLLAGRQFVLYSPQPQSSSTPSSLTGSENNQSPQVPLIAAGSFLRFPRHSKDVYTLLPKGSIALCEQGYRNDSDFPIDGTSPRPPPDLTGGMNYHHDYDSNDKENLRTLQTAADYYYAKRGCIPRPQTIHHVLSEDQLLGPTTTEDTKGILVIGDVHGCLEELLILYDQAVLENDNTKFKCVILVGDLSNKGKFSAATIRFVRQQQHWFAIRGNHDDGALNAALGDNERRNKKHYQWVMEGEIPNTKGAATTTATDSTNHNNENVDKKKTTSSTTTLSDNDVMWLSELPYTITIPSSLLFDNTDMDTTSSSSSSDVEDTVIVHAGLIPGVKLEDQSIETMITLREVVPIKDDNGSHIGYGYFRRPAKKQIIAPGQSTITNKQIEKQQLQPQERPVPWATVWSGPQRVIFGHDARRGFQRYKGDWAIGLDTGACYGKQLTGIILPEKKIVSVDAVDEHCPIVSKEKSG